MPDSRNSREAFRVELAEAYKRAQALFVVLIGLCGYVVLAIFDRRPTVEAVRALDDAEHLQHDAVTALERAQTQCSEQHVRWSKSLREWRPEREPTDDLPEDCDRNCVSGGESKPAGCGPKTQLARDEIALARSYLATSERSSRLKRELEQAKKRLAAAAETWEHERNPDPQIQGQLRAAYMRARSDEVEAEKQQRIAQVRTERKNGGALARALIDSAEVLEDARGGAARARDAFRAAEDSLTRARKHLGEVQNARLKLPVVDIELDRSSFQLVASPLVFLMFVFFALYLLHLQRRVQRARERALVIEAEGSTSAYPWPVLFEGDYAPAHRFATCVAAFVPVPLSLLAMQLAPGGAAVGSLPRNIAGVMGVLLPAVAFAIALYLLWRFRTARMATASPARTRKGNR